MTDTTIAFIVSPGWTVGSRCAPPSPVSGEQYRAMNISTAIGIGGGMLLIAVAIAMSLDSPAALWDPLSMVVVLGGTLAAAFIAFPMSELRRISSVFFIVLRNEKMYARDDMMELVEVARALMKADIRTTEKKMVSIIQVLTAHDYIHSRRMLPMLMKSF